MLSVRTLETSLGVTLGVTLDIGTSSLGTLVGVLSVRSLMLEEHTHFSATVHMLLQSVPTIKENHVQVKHKQLVY